MTTETIDKSTEQSTVQERQPTKEEQEAEAGFAAGFAKARGAEAAPEKTDETTTTTTAAAEQPAPEKKEGAAAAAAPDPWKDVNPLVRQKLEALEALPNQIRNLAGHIGGLNSKMDSALATAKAAATEKGGAAAAPTDKQIQSAIANPEAWKKLKEDYPDWAEPLEQQFSSIRAEIAEVSKKAKPAVDVGALKSEVTSGVNAAISAGLDAAEERAFVRLKHPDWKSTVNTQEFKSWTLQGGPSAESYASMKALEQTDPAKADAMVNAWTREFPQWWADRGAAIFDDRADAAIKLLDGFKAHRESPPPNDQKRLRSQQRLEGAVPARGTSSPPSTGLSDEAAFERGFKKARGGKT